MKKISLAIVLSMFFAVAYAQKDVTRFLGIPVDGKKSDMVSKLIAKGFQLDMKFGALVGEFNGTDVHVFVGTNNNKVCRIMVCDQNVIDEASIKIRFNNLCRQFKKNTKYKSFIDYIIPDEENISYEMLVNKKRYEAVFYQEPAEIDTIAIAEKVWSELLTKYTEEQLKQPTEELFSELNKHIAISLLECYRKKPVWFMISEMEGEGYYITMFYDNEYNRASGEDL